MAEQTGIPSTPQQPRHTGRPRPNGLQLALLRMPRYLYRIGLGRLLGHRFLLLTHRGRRSGKLYQTVIEAVSYDPTTHESLVVSGWGERADWYRNIRANPAVEVRTGHERYVPRQRFLDPQEAYTALTAYERDHPRLARTIARRMGYELDGSEATRRRFAQEIRMVAFRPA